MVNYHTPRCRIRWTNVASGPSNNVVDTDSVKLYQPLHLFVGVEIDSGIFLTSGYFNINFDVLLDGKRYGKTWSGWTATDLPRTWTWYAMYWPRARDLLGLGGAVYLYQPSIKFTMWGPGGTGISSIPDEFAVAEEPHYLSADY